MKEYIIYAGVNGAGKSTLYNLADEKVVYRVNSDEIILKSGGDWRNSESAISAMRKSIGLIKEYLSENVSFCQETTLTGNMIFKNINDAKKLGYKITMHYVGLENVDLSMKRVADRVRRGGHGIPEPDLIRRFDVSQNNLKRAVLLCDDVLVYDNTSYFRLIATFFNGKLLKRNDDGIAWFSALYPPLSS